MGIPLYKLTENKEDQGKWILPDGIELYPVSVTENHKHIMPQVNVEYEATHIFLTNLDFNKQKAAVR